MTDAFTLLAITGTFLVAGTVKGVVGMGLPVISLAFLTVALGLHEAMGLMLAPALATNLWQAFVGGHGRDVLRRIWPFLVMAAATVWIGSMALTRVDLHWLSALLGLLLVAYALTSLSGWNPALPPRRAAWAGPLIGAVNGILTGMTGAFVMPGIFYLRAIGLARDALIQALGMLFTVSTLALGISLGANALVTAETGALSIAALVPALLGMVIGTRIRRRLSERVFRRLFFAALLALGAYIFFRAGLGIF